MVAIDKLGIVHRPGSRVVCVCIVYHRPTDRFAMTSV